ncbi:hypothetical protein SCLCIDRAFT_1221629 [Scleroderma citrinum Foug A]|uniref:PAS domain-containing protein n=1 Tax=Scleroderma citrinum Foug A TaxID=1036808 RepID=A0A0C3DFE7_9AGAM|nr:hypothetical protein SCLCIDRAFT_1221629 [Scleroderma citrinum Foug A]
MDFNTPRLSCIAIVDFSQDIRFVYVTESFTELLGWDTRETIGRPGADLVHPDEFSVVRELHYDTIRQDKAAVLAYLRLKHKDPLKGFVLCAISRTIVHNVLVGSITPATQGVKALQNASTAQEVDFVTPYARDFEFRRWGDPSPMPPSPLPDFCTLLDETVDGAEPSAERKDGLLSFKPLPKQSPRVALILDRFSIHCPIQYCSNDLFVETTTVMGRSFYDFVLPKNEHQVREWIDVIKAWGVNERGQPSNGGFGYGKFTLLPKGRDSRGERINDGADGKTTTNRRRDILASSRGHSARPHPQSGGHNRPRPQVHVYTKETVVDAIFSAHSDGILVILRPTTLPSP